MKSFMCCTRSLKRVGLFPSLLVQSWEVRGCFNLPASLVTSLSRGCTGAASSLDPGMLVLTMDSRGSSLSIVQTSFSSSESWTSSMTTSSHLLLFRLCVSSCVLAVKLRICFETNLLAASHVLCGCSPPSFGAPGSVGKTLYCCDTGGISVVALTRTVYTGGSVAATVLACTGSWGLLAGVSCAEDVAVTLTSGGGTA